MRKPAMFSEDVRNLLAKAAIGAAAILLVGLLVAPERVWSNLFVATFFVLTVGLGGTLFVALTSVAGAGWNVAFRRVPEAVATIVPFAGALLVVVLTMRASRYGWHPHGAGAAGTFWFKELWLTPSFWCVRGVGYVVVWSVLGRWLVLRSRSQGDGSSTPDERSGTVRLSAVFLVVYAVTFSLASTDWIMALEPMWFSTMWGVYNFSGMILATLAALVVFSILLSKHGGPLHGVFNSEHLHDLGKLLVGFSCFWMYIWFSQYMLIWYSNIPEETSYFIARTHGPWGPVVVVSIVLNWLLPFFLLLPRPAKRSRGVMLRVAIILLIGRWVDLYVMVFPPTVGDTPVFGVLEIAAIICGAVALLVAVNRSFQAATPVPLQDTRLEESLSYHAN